MYVPEMCYDLARVCSEMAAVVCNHKQAVRRDPRHSDWPKCGHILSKDLIQDISAIDWSKNGCAGDLRSRRSVMRWRGDPVVRVPSRALPNHQLEAGAVDNGVDRGAHVAILHRWQAPAAGTVAIHRGNRTRAREPRLGNPINLVEQLRAWTRSPGGEGFPHGKAIELWECSLRIHLKYHQQSVRKDR